MNRKQAIVLFFMGFAFLLICSIVPQECHFHVCLPSQKATVSYFLPVVLISVIFLFYLRDKTKKFGSLTGIGLALLFMFLGILEGEYYFILTFYIVVLFTSVSGIVFVVSFLRRLFNKK